MRTLQAIAILALISSAAYAYESQVSRENCPSAVDVLAKIRDANGLPDPLIGDFSVKKSQGSLDDCKGATVQSGPSFEPTDATCRYRYMRRMEGGPIRACHIWLKKPAPVKAARKR